MNFRGAEEAGEDKGLGVGFWVKVWALCFLRYMTELE